MPVKSKFKMKGFILALNLRTYSPYSPSLQGKSWQKEHEEAGHITSTVRSRGMNTVLNLLSPFYLIQEVSLRKGATSILDIFPLQLT